MSFDVHAIVPADSWPTFKGLNEAMSRRGYPASLEGFESEDDSFRPVPSIQQRHGLTQEQIGEWDCLDTGALVKLESSTVEPDFHYEPIDAQSLARLHATLRKIDAETGDCRLGEILVTHSGHSDPDSWNAGVYLLCALILDFDGYGFDLQGGAHGRADFAAELFDALDSGQPNA